MILMAIVPIVREHQIGIERLQSLEELLDFLPFEWKEAGPKLLHHDFPSRRILEKITGAALRLQGPPAPGAKDDPTDVEILVFPGHFQQSPPTPNLDVIR